MEENNQNASPVQLPALQQPVVQPSRPTSGTNIYVGAGSGGRAKQMPSRKRLFMIAGAATVLVLATGGYVIGFYMPNRPSAIFKAALNNTAEGYDQLVAYADKVQSSNAFNNTQIDGTYSIDSGDATVDGTLAAHIDNGNSTFSTDIGMSGIRVKLEGMTKKVNSSDIPDAYLKLSGIRGLGANVNMPRLDTLDGQWVSVDHTLFSNLAKSPAGSSSGASPTVTVPSEKDVIAAARAAGTVARKYYFSTTPGTAVFKMTSFVGKETAEGKAANHYKVIVNKDHVKAFANELGAELDKTKLNDWAKANYGKSLSALVDVDGMKKSADGIKPGETFDLWVNTKTKLVHKIRVSDTSTANKDTHYELGLNYDGGAEKPFFVNTYTKEGVTTATVNFGISVNTDTNAVKLTLNAQSDTGGHKATMTLNAIAKPTTSRVQVTVPAGTITLLDAFNRAGLTSYYGAVPSGLGGALQNTSQADANPFTISL
ncbi:MAG TPA: hypothetical protein VIR03_01115 [Candidatus Saccharimonadales bacterium]